MNASLPLAEAPASRAENWLDHALLAIQKYALLALVVSLPLGWRYLTRQPFAISWINLLAWAFLVVTAVRMVALAAEAKLPAATARPKYLPELLTAALILMAMLVATLSTPSLRDAVGYLGTRFLQPVLVALVIGWMLARRELSAAEALVGLAISLIIPVGWGIAQIAGWLPFQDTNRVTAGYAFPNTFARLIGGVLLVLAPSALVVSGKWRGWVLAGLAIAAFVLLRTYSYNAVASAAIATLVMAGMLPRRWRLVQFGAIILVMVGTAGAVLLAPQLPKWQMTITSSRETRLQFWEVARGVIRDHPLTGIGFKSWEKRYPELVNRYATPPLKLLASPQPHNFYLDGGVKAGFLGIIAFPLLYFVPALRAGRTAWLRRGRPWGFSEALLVGIAGWSAFMLSFGLLDDPLWSDDIVVLAYGLFVVAAVLAAAHRHEEGAFGGE